MSRIERGFEFQCRFPQLGFAGLVIYRRDTNSVCLNHSLFTPGICPVDRLRSTAALRQIVIMAVLVVMLSSCALTSDPLADPVGSPVAAVVPTATPTSTPKPIKRPHGVPKTAVPASVEAVLNGDRVNVITTEGRYTVFLLSIDAPDATPSSGSPECFGPEAKAKLSRMLEPEQQIWLEPDKTYQDPSGRMVRYVWLPGDGKKQATLVNRSLLAGGYATGNWYRWA